MRHSIRKPVREELAAIAPARSTAPNVMRGLARPLAACLVALVLLVFRASAEPESADGAPRPGEARVRMGPVASVGGAATALWIGDVAGGRSTGGVVNALGMLWADLDLANFIRVPGTRAHASLACIRGRSATAEYVGDALVVSNLEGCETTRLYEAWIEKDLLAERLGVRIGAMAADGEFAIAEAASLFTNSAFGWTPGIAANIVNGGPVYSAPALGVRVAARPGEDWTVLGAAWDGDSFDSPDGDPDVNRYGTHFDLDASQGRFWLAELQHARGGGGVPRPALGWKVGGWLHTAAFADLRHDAAGLPTATSGAAPALHRGNRGAYALVEQCARRTAAGAPAGPAVWLRVAIAQADRSPFSKVVDGGLAWSGPWRRRPQDTIGLAIVHAAVSPWAVQGALDAHAASGTSGPVPDGERVVELAYACRVGGRLSVTPGLQWVRHPGGSAGIPDALVPELRVSFE